MSARDAALLALRDCGVIRVRRQTELGYQLLFDEGLIAFIRNEPGQWVDVRLNHAGLAHVRDTEALPA